MTTLVVVESPAKAKTIYKFLGKGYRVLASYGHVRDLPSKNGSVDPDDGFRMRYAVPSGSAKHVETLMKAIKNADALLLATDPDREGEAISWHVQEVLKDKKALQETPVRRVVFHEITRRAVEEAVQNARDLNMNLVNAQQARRALDYLVGFNLSPLLWKKVRRGLSAGRVQSVALRLVCEREREIQAFKSREYWSIWVEAVKRKAEAKETFPARLVVADSKKLKKFDIADQEQAMRLVRAIEKRPLFVTGLTKKQIRRNPAPPFITSTLQQEASRKLGFSAKRAMALAQQLYEGREVPIVGGAGKEVAGLITYMRTDSVTLAGEAIERLRHQITERYGEAFLPNKPRRFKSSAKNAQEAHEAIRPTLPERTPESLTDFLPKDLLNLYTLIWKRAVASQMAPARIDQVAADLSVEQNSVEAPYRLRATGSSIAFPGFMAVYQESRDAVSLQDRKEGEGDNGESGLLPHLVEGEVLDQNKVDPRQHATEPPPRYTEASLVKILESYGIGRPSTYAPIMSTLQDRGYVRLEKRKFHTEDVGMVVNDFLVAHFQDYVDYHFTARLEDDLDAISRGEKTWTPLLQKFWDPFIQRIQEKEKTTKRSEITSEEIDEHCPKCGASMLIKLGRFGRFKACSGYPECKHTENLKKEAHEGDADSGEGEEPVVSDQSCGKCGKPMLIKKGRYGKYLACSGYPDCRNNQPLEKPKETGVVCPLCQKGQFLEKKSRRGKLFYSCSGYPTCKNALWDKPIQQPCPQCDASFLTVKITKKRGTEHLCVAKECDFREVVES